MAEPKDYLGILWRDNINLDSEDPKQFLENVKNRLIAEGAKPGTQEYSDAFMSFIGMKSQAAKQANIQAGGLVIRPSQAGVNAQNYLNKNMTVDQIGKELGLNAINLGIGKDVKGAWRNQAGEVILANDPYARNQMGEREFDAQGRPLYAGYTPGTITNISDGVKTYKLSDFETVPDWVFDIFGPQYNKREVPGGGVEGYQREIPQELVAMGFKPGAKVTPEMVAAYEKYSLSRLSPQVYSMVTGQPYAPGYDLQGNYVGLNPQGDGTGEGDGEGTGLNYGSGLARDTFKNTLALFFGEKEVTKPWMDSLYKVVSKYFRSGSTADESFNLALQDARTNPELKPFANRFKGVYALQDMRVAGKPVLVPTIAEYVVSQAKMGDVLTNAGLPELATDEFTTDLISKGNSVTTVADKIAKAFARIDTAPMAIKDTLSRYFPTVDRTKLARTLLLGQKGADALVEELSQYEVLAAAEQQGIGAINRPGGLTAERAGEYARMGGTFGSLLPKFGQIAQALPTTTKLSQISRRQDIGQVGLEKALIGSSAKELAELEKLTAEEEARFRGRSGQAQLGPASQRRAIAGLL